MGDLKRGYFGFQFHPEVIHTKHGSEILENFVVKVCGCSQDWHPEDRVTALEKHLERDWQQAVGDLTAGGTRLKFLFARGRSSIG